MRMCHKCKLYNCLTIVLLALLSGFPCWTKGQLLPVFENCVSPGLVALTFDDGPTPNGQTQRVLEVLREKGVKATFFVTGQGWDPTFLSSDERKRALLRQIYDEGHQIGSHTWTHLNLVNDFSEQHILADLARLSNVVSELLNVNMTVFRPPYGLSNDTVVSLIQQQFGYKFVRWNLDTRDWEHRENVENSFREYQDAMREETANTSSSSFIAIHHDPAPRSDQLARLAIDFVRSKGFKLVTVGECIGVPDFISSPASGLPAWTNGQLLPVFQSCVSPGLVALTFDDGPTPNGQTLRVLEVLREKGVKATFFVTGQGWDPTFLSSDERKRALLRQIYDEGHQIGSHTWTHLNLVNDFTEQHILADLARLSNVVSELLNVNMTVFRPPYGLSNDTVVSLIQQQFGYEIVGWNLDTRDWEHRENVENSFREYQDAMKEADNGSSSFIAIHHDPAPRSDQLARLAIDFVRSKGFKLVTVGECIGVPNFNKARK